MKEVNKYFKSYDGSSKKIDYLKYGLFNERGYDLDYNPKKDINIENLRKTNCDHQAK